MQVSPRVPPFPFHSHLLNGHIISQTLARFMSFGTCRLGHQIDVLFTLININSMGTTRANISLKIVLNEDEH